MRKMMTLLLIAAATVAYGQDNLPSDFHRLTLEQALQQFDKSNNAAGMGLFQPASGSQTYLKGFYSAGNFHLAQQGSSDPGFEFATLRYDSLGEKLFMKGSFHYTFDSEKGRAWSDVRDPWFSIPYIYGCDIAKDYDTHNCGLTFDLYTSPLNDIISLGIKTTYEVADISGKRDPRPRTGYLDYQLVPSAMLTFGRHHIGLGAGYGYSKEKLTNLTTVQSNPNIYYYKMSGLDNIDGALSAYSGFKRQFAGSRFLTEATYSYGGEAVSLLVGGGMQYSRLDAIGDKMQTPGSYNCFRYNALGDLVVKGGRTLHKIHLSGVMDDGGADEYLQELVNTKDEVTGVATETWNTLYTYTNRYMLKKLDAALDYTLYGGYTGTDYLWSAAIGAEYSKWSKLFYLPESNFGTSGIRLSAGGSVLLLRAKGHKIDLEAKGGYYMHGDTYKSFVSENVYTQQVLDKDYDYYCHNFAFASAALTWT
ncbi:MAG: hypothetical protein II963_07085, partial [Bacteroidales bacterium]|nr:hypothetical protein [Bacteroidales bacterium]